jgi:nucleoside-diphosphate-sugar epimerase
MTQDLKVVLGASGGIGNAVVLALAGQGHRVRAVNRSGSAEVPPGVERVAADVSAPDGAALAVRGASVVYHCAQPSYTRWAEAFPAMNRTVATATATEGARLVYADNLYMYDASRGPITEATLEDPATGRGRLRKRLADDLLEAHRSGALRVTIGRASDYYGPHGTYSNLGDRLFRAILAGKKAQWMGSLDQPHTCSYLPDVGRALTIIGEHDGADGRVWILPADEPITGRAFIELAGAAAGTAPKPAAITPGLLKVVGLFVPMLRALAEMSGEWTAPFTADAGAFDIAFGPFEVTPHAEALATTVAWFRGQAPPAAA